MGTRSIVVIKNGKGEDITHIYRQFDGYPSGMGTDLVNFLKGRKLVNGFNKAKPTISNGMEDLAAQLICYLKSGNITGNVYVYPPKKLEVNQFGDYYWADYIYYVVRDEDSIVLTCYDPDKILFQYDSIKGFIIGEIKNDR